MSKKSVFKKIGKVILSIVLIIAIALCCCAIVSRIGIQSNTAFVNSLDSVKYDNQLKPEKDENGYTTFVTDDDFKILQISDTHIGGGFLTISKDSMALNAVAAMVTAEKPDLVIVTGDIVYPVPFQSGTMNNKKSAKLFATLMEDLGVYWCPLFGNHDTEAYSYYSRKQMSSFYSQEKWKHCLYEAGPEDVDGYGNYIVNVKNTQGKITQSLVILDTGAYIDDPLGINWKYDTIHANQVQWYESELNNIKSINKGVMPKSLAFFHMPIREYQDAYKEYASNGYKDTENVKYFFGESGEPDPYVYPSEANYGFFNKCLELGSTQGMFCGHDHLNNFSLEYKGIRLTYGFTIDYLAYSGIKDYGLQRGCTVITVKTDGTFDCNQENYYQDKYESVKEKETVLNEHYYSDEERAPTKVAENKNALAVN